MLHRAVDRIYQLFTFDLDHFAVPDHFKCVGVIDPVARIKGQQVKLAFLDTRHVLTHLNIAR